MAGRGEGRERIEREGVNLSAGWAYGERGFFLGRLGNWAGLVSLPYLRDCIRLDCIRVTMLILGFIFFISQEFFTNFLFSDAVCRSCCMHGWLRNNKIIIIQKNNIVVIHTHAYLTYPMLPFLPTQKQ